MQALCFLIVGLLLSFAWLSPFHTYPWVTFSSELASFGAALAVGGLFFNKSIKIPRPQILMLGIVIIPMCQWALGLITDFSTAFLSFAYLFMFWFMIIAGYNLSLQARHRERIMLGISYLLLSISFISAIMAILQWLNLEAYFDAVMKLRGNRPYANFGQPNNLATFLIMGLMGGLYLYEKRRLTLWLLIPTSLVTLFAITLTQSRTSWVVCIFLFFYWIFKQYKNSPRFNFPRLLLWVGLYFVIASYLLPLVTQLLTSSIDTGVTQTASIAQRAGSGHERIGMWTQILHAIAERPWFGYGWNQTSIAVFESIDFNTVQVWFNSAHNIFLDILVWNGIPLGFLIIGYIGLWLFWLNKNAKDTTSVLAILMVCAILIHAMLEFPQRYAYFLLPMGFLLGLIQAQTPNLKAIVLHKNVIRCIWLVVIVILLLMWRDYKLFQENSSLVFKKQQPTVEILGSSKILLLTQFQQRLDWIVLNPKTIMSEADLTQLGEMVKNKATPYNLKKYAQLLVYNKKITEAERQLVVLNQLYKQKLSLAEIIELNHKTQ
ncbi:Wzy polymerase domain-containing protein [Acinetobacter sp. C26M]|uniref:PglL family O-oligosaccharyltransferase n=1 Tax=unclassified Acinetobacter TaxID=196816 RepID=UPI002036B5FD|nr:MULTISPECIES: O-antigen ligase family protein [unclassified Acinetobacter]USA46845.1 Wzy polymerase domain-containing protein [Acinetobacter sp. C26M]USA50329.1 Wzy polymerase domain-containing protein [Acinetobacter sp. C26G]